MAGMFKRLFGAGAAAMLKELPNVPAGIPFLSEHINRAAQPSSHAAIAHSIEAEAAQANALPVFGVSLEVILARPAEQQHDIPEFVDQMLRYLQQRALKAEGIFRISGDGLHIQTLKTAFDKGNFKQALSQWKDYHSVAGLFKLFLRELPEPVFPYRLYDSFIATQLRTEPSQQLAGIWELLKEFPSAHKRLLKRLVEFLLEVVKYSEENKMTTSSLAIVFAPNLLRPKNADTLQFISDARYINSIVRTILEQYEMLLSALEDNEVASEEDASEGVGAPQPPRRRQWRKQQVEASPQEQQDEQENIAALTLTPLPPVRKVSSAGALVGRRIMEPGDFTTRIYQDLASPGGLIIQIQEPVCGDGDPTLAPQFSSTPISGVGVGMRYLDLQISFGIDLPSSSSNRKGTTNTDNINEFRTKQFPLEQIKSSTSSIQLPSTPLATQQTAQEQTELSMSKPVDPPPTPTSATDVFHCTTPCNTTSESRQEPHEPILFQKANNSNNGIISSSPSSIPDSPTTDKCNNNETSDTRRIGDDTMSARITTSIDTRAPNSEENTNEMALLLADPYAYITNKLALDQSQKHRPESIRAMSLSEMKDEKELLKKLLYEFNYAIEKQYSRLPNRDDKEPLRQFYRQYRMLKRRIELFSSENQHERSRSFSSITDLKEEEGAILKRIEQCKGEPQTQEKLQFEVAKLKTIQRLISEWDARVG